MVLLSAREGVDYTRELLRKCFEVHLSHPLHTVLTELLCWRDVARLEVAVASEKKLLSEMREFLHYYVFRGRSLQPEKLWSISSSNHVQLKKCHMSPAEFQWLMTRGVKSDTLKFSSEGGWNWSIMR